MASDVVKGGWAPDEDEKSVKGIEIRNKLMWSLVASVVQSGPNSDQCAKRWTDILNTAPLGHWTRYVHDPDRLKSTPT